MGDPRSAGLVEERDVCGHATFLRRNGTSARILRAATVRRVEPGFRAGSGPLIIHLGRWERLKDPLGVLEAFIRHVPSRLEAHLMLAGPAVEAVTDDPEGRLVLDELERA